MTDCNRQCTHKAIRIQRFKSGRATIKAVKARQIFDSHGNPTVENDVDANMDEDDVDANVDKDDVDANVYEDEVDANVDEDEMKTMLTLMYEDDVDANVDANVNPNIDIFDPRNWDGLNRNMINDLVKKGPKRDLNMNKGPVDKHGRRFSTSIYTRILPNRETCDREWLVYSKELDKLFCFCCKIFRQGHPKGTLDGEGFSDWKHATRLKYHEVSVEHLKNMKQWFEMRQMLDCNTTIDKVAYEQFKKERDYWKKVILRIIQLVKFLAKHGLAFRGPNEKLYKKGNGNFLGLVEILEEFDPIMKEYVWRIMNDETHIHYLG
ncbi:zinc finger MYM-type protein 5-like [Helianthus annuus]|uniref:zinc finger MYM-type protein 5-like n=1 Tax=Helianthus annuus TaxID=4232 RepID=UPI000B8F9E56|nr:zinc finger MYM-type protein 5-like [Helianthus annuus]